MQFISQNWLWLASLLIGTVAAIVTLFVANTLRRAGLAQATTEESRTPADPALAAAALTTRHNEKLKLIANALDRASTASFSAGIFTPGVSVAQGTGQVSQSSLPATAPGPTQFSLTDAATWNWSLIGIFIVFLVLGSLLHYLARNTLKDLR